MLYFFPILYVIIIEILVNLIWLLSIALIVVLFGPVLFQVFKPLFVHLVQLSYKITEMLYKIRKELGYLALIMILIQNIIIIILTIEMV